MKNNKTEYNLELSDLESKERLKKLIDLHYEYIEILNYDSEDSLDGGARCHYKVKIEFEEIWVWNTKIHIKIEECKMINSYDFHKLIDDLKRVARIIVILQNEVNKKQKERLGTLALDELQKLTDDLEEIKKQND